MVTRIEKSEPYSLDFKSLKRHFTFFLLAQLLLIGSVILYIGFDFEYLLLVNLSFIVIIAAILLYFQAPHWIVFCEILLAALPGYHLLSFWSIDLMSLWLTLSLLFSCFVVTSNQLNLGKIDLYIMLYSGVILISGLAGGNLDPKLRITLFGFITFFSARSFIKGERQLRLAFLLVPIYGLLLMLQMTASFAQHHAELFTFSFSRKEADVSWGSTNYLAALLVLVTPLTLSLFFAARKVRWKMLLLALIASMTLGVFWTISRTGAICLGIILMTFLFNFSKRKFLILIACLLAVYFLLAPYIGKVISRFSTRDVASYLSVVERENLWEGTWKIFKENPLIGVGMYNAEVVTFLKSRSTDPHNIILKSLAETGIIGFALLLLIFRELFRKVFELRAVVKRTGKEKIIYTGFLLTLSISVLNRMFEVIGDRYEILFWCIMALLFLLVENKSRNSCFVLLEARK